MCTFARGASVLRCSWPICAHLPADGWCRADAGWVDHHGSTRARMPRRSGRLILVPRTKANAHGAGQVAVHDFKLGQDGAAFLTLNHDSRNRLQLTQVLADATVVLGWITVASPIVLQCDCVRPRRGSMFALCLLSQTYQQIGMTAVALGTHTCEHPEPCRFFAHSRHSNRL